MGKRILAQRKGRGSLPFRSPSHRHIGTAKYRPFLENQDQFTFKVIEFLHSPGRGAPLALIKYNDDRKALWLPPEGIFEGQKFTQSKSKIRLIQPPQFFETVRQAFSRNPSGNGSSPSNINW